jgi:hypothetical protein
MIVLSSCQKSPRMRQNSADSCVSSTRVSDELPATRGKVLLGSRWHCGSSSPGVSRSLGGEADDTQVSECSFPRYRLARSFITSYVRAADDPLRREFCINRFTHRFTPLRARRALAFYSISSSQGPASDMTRKENREGGVSSWR